MHSVLILGATGRMANRVAIYLGNLHPEVKLRLASSRSEGVASLKKQFPQAEVVLADWYSIDSMTKAVYGIDRILYIPPDRTNETIATPNIIDAVKNSGSHAEIVRLILHAPGKTLDSICPVLRNANIGEAMHIIGREILDKSGLTVTYVNIPAWIMMSIPWFLAPEVKAQRQLQMPHDRYWTWLDERDIAEIFVKLLCEDGYSGKEYMITGPTKYSFSDLAKMISEVIGEEVTYSESEEGIRKAFGDEAEVYLEYFYREREHYSGIEPTDTVQKILGRPPRSLQAYLKEHISVF